MKNLLINQILLDKVSENKLYKEELLGLKSNHTLDRLDEAYIKKVEELEQKIKVNDNIIYITLLSERVNKKTENHAYFTASLYLDKFNLENLTFYHAFRFYSNLGEEMAEEFDTKFTLKELSELDKPQILSIYKEKIEETLSTFDAKDHSDLLISMKGKHGIPDDEEALIKDALEIGETIDSIKELSLEEIVLLEKEVNENLYEEELER